MYPNTLTNFLLLYFRQNFCRCRQALQNHIQFYYFIIFTKNDKLYLSKNNQYFTESIVLALFFLFKIRGIFMEFLASP